MKQSKVLIVDDDQHSLQTLMLLLNKKPEKYQALTAPNGKIAAQIIKETMPDLVITDWEMPHGNGIELIKHLKGNPATAGIPTIIITGIKTTAENLQMAFDAGASDYLTKPINHLELYARADSALGMYYALRTIEAQKQMIEDQKNRELSAKLIELAKKNHLLEEVFKTVYEASYHLAGNMKQEIRSLAKKIDSDLKVNNEWEAFKLHFEQVHPRFFAQVQKKYPSLSQNDLRHCAYIRIGLINKEISHILGITSESVVKQHYRIKKKMNIPADKTLSDVIRQL